MARSSLHFRKHSLSRLRNELGRSKNERDQLGNRHRSPGKRPIACTWALLVLMMRKQMKEMFWCIGYGAKKIRDDKDDSQVSGLSN